jgi:MarR family transcriptional regulator for hemolysin
LDKDIDFFRRICTDDVFMRREKLVFSNREFLKMRKTGELTELLILAGQVVMAAKEKALASYDVTSSQYRVMSILEGMGGVTATVLARHTKLDNGTLSRVVNRLERIGMVERRPDGKDRRCVCLYLTEKGNTVLPSMSDAVEQIHSVINNTEVDAELEHIAHFLRAVAEHASNLNTEPDYGSSNFATLGVAP